MNDAAPLRVSIDAGVAVVELDNPPVNALFGDIRDGLADLMPRLDADDTVGAILVVSAGSAFCAGVDLKKTASQAEPFFFHAALDAMDRVHKPIGAAIQGAALGGGLELALACHYRLAGPNARFGLPEVDVGIIPGACGTQRLPRIVSIDRALGVAALGDILRRDEATALGLVDAQAQDDDFRGEAIRWARTLIGKPVRRTRDLPVLAGAAPDRAFAAAMARAESERPGEAAPLKAIAAVRAAVERSFDDGVVEEKRLVTECKYSAEAKAMRHLFFAERAAGKTGVAPASLPALAIYGSQAASLRDLVPAGGVVKDAVAIHVVAPGEATPEDDIAIVLPPRRSGVVELSIPAGTEEGLIGAVAKLLRGYARATVISRGARIDRSLVTAAGDAAFRHPSHDRIERLAAAADQLVAAGVATSSGDVDLVAVGLLDFPRALGGPAYAQSTKSPHESR